MKAEELDQKFDDEEDLLAYFDLFNSKRPGLEAQEINVDFPQWMLDALAPPRTWGLTPHISR